IYDEAYSPLEGFPVTISENSNVLPYPLNIADIEQDGTKEVIFATNEHSGGYYIYTFDIKGKEKGKIKVKEKVFAHIKFNDMDNDGNLEYIFADFEGNLHVTDIKGNALDGFPVKAGERIKGAPFVLDTDGDGKCEILVVTWRESDSNGTLKVYDSKGKNAGDDHDLGPISKILINRDVFLADLDGNGLLELLKIGDDKLKVEETEYRVPVVIEKIYSNTSYGSGD
ncbi:MAG: FG-GAP-like repeat-containing protein, partial [Candidatus Muiribacteriaceae bacterium]